MSLTSIIIAWHDFIFLKKNVWSAKRAARCSKEPATTMSTTPAAESKLKLLSIWGSSMSHPLLSSQTQLNDSGLGKAPAGCVQRSRLTQQWCTEVSYPIVLHSAFHIRKLDINQRIRLWYCPHVLLHPYSTCVKLVHAYYKFSIWFVGGAVPGPTYFSAMMKV